MPSKVWVAGEEVLAADWNTYVQEQVVATFANAAQRTAQLPTPKEGQLSYLIDVAQVQQYTSGVWRVLNAGATGWLGSKGLSGNAGNNNQWYDVSGGGVAVQCGAARKIRVDVLASFYSVIGSLRHVNVRVVRSAGGTGSATLGQTGDSLGPSSSKDLAYIACAVFDTTTTAGSYTYRVDAQTDHTADVGFAAGGMTQQYNVSDAGPATPGPQ